MIIIIIKRCVKQNLKYIASALTKCEKKTEIANEIPSLITDKLKLNEEKTATQGKRYTSVRALSTTKTRKCTKMKTTFGRER